MWVMDQKQAGTATNAKSWRRLRIRVENRERKLVRYDKDLENNEDHEVWGFIFIFQYFLNNIKFWIE